MDLKGRIQNIGFIPNLQPWQYCTHLLLCRPVQSGSNTSCTSGSWEGWDCPTSMGRNKVSISKAGTNKQDQIFTSVPDPRVFGPPGSGSTSQRFGSGSCSGSGSGSFFHHAKIVKKTLIPTILWLFFTFYLCKMMYMWLQNVISRKNCIKKLVFCWHLEGQWRK